MRIRMNTKAMCNVLEDIQMKGKYHNGDTAKNSQLSNYAMLELHDDDTLSVYNADMTTICSIRFPILGAEGDERPLVTIEIDKTLKYLKTFSETVTLDIDSYIKVSDDSSTASLPLVVSHPNASMIARLQGYTIDEDNPTFSKVEFETSIVTTSDNLTDAVKRCDVLNNARYRFDIDVSSNKFMISSERSVTDRIETSVSFTEVNGESSTVEVTGQFHKFFRTNTPVRIYLKDDSPVLWEGTGRILVKAPYLAR